MGVTCGHSGVIEVTWGQNAGLIFFIDWEIDDRGISITSRKVINILPLANCKVEFNTGTPFSMTKTHLWRNQQFLEFDKIFQEIVFIAGGNL